MEDALNHATLLYPWTEVQKMEYNAIMSLTLAQIEYLIVTIDDDRHSGDDHFWRINVINEWNRVNIKG